MLDFDFNNLKTFAVWCSKQVFTLLWRPPQTLSMSLHKGSDKPKQYVNLLHPQAWIKGLETKYIQIVLLQGATSGLHVFGGFRIRVFAWELSNLAIRLHVRHVPEPPLHAPTRKHTT